MELESCTANDNKSDDIGDANEIKGRTPLRKQENVGIFSKWPNPWFGNPFCIIFFGEIW